MRILAGLVFITVCSAALALDLRASNASTLLKNGREAAQFCRHCHGEGGVSPHADVPNLAGQNAAYLLDQMNKFAAGQRKSEFMEGLIKALKPEERASIALYFSQEKVAPRVAGNGGEAEEGRALYTRLCRHCHGEEAHGTERVPRLAGQHDSYLQLSLRRYRNGGGERIDPKMSAYTRNLNDRDIANLAAYLTRLR
jgi:cytochrome c553